MKIAIFPTCLVDHIKPEIVKNLLKLLKPVSSKIFIPEKRLCCGQIAFNAGDWESARKMAINWLKTYKGFDPDYIVSPSASCVSMVRNNFKLLFENTKFSGISSRLSQKTFELTEFLYEITGLQLINTNFPEKVAVHFSCHYLRGLKRKNELIEVLKKVKGLEIVHFEKPELCCGFGGIFSLKYPELSEYMARRKLNTLQQEAKYITSTDLSCLIHMNRIDHKHRFIHIAEILANE